MLIAIPLFMLFMFIEFLIGRRQGKKLYRLNDTIVNLAHGIGNQAFSLMFKALLLGFYVLIYNKLAIFPETFEASWYSVIICLVVFDFLYYWAHRWSHEWNFLWAAHVVHHQSEEYNLSVALRQSWFHNLLAFFIFLPIPILGFDPMVFIGISAFVTLYQFWVHTKAIQRMPRWFEFIFNSPAHHRVHHARNPKYIDKNHAAVFIFWDRLFGTFKEEEEEPTYGITTPLKSFNPLWGNLHYWVDILKLAWRAPKWSDKFKAFFARPGWQPEELGGYQAPPEVDKQALERYDQKAPLRLRIYAIVQFVGVLIGLVAFMHNFDRLSWAYRWLFLGLMVVSLVICTAILENKKWVIYVEYIRLILVLFSINSLYYFFFLEWLPLMLIASLSLTVISVLAFSLVWRSQKPKLQD